MSFGRNRTQRIARPRGSRLRLAAAGLAILFSAAAGAAGGFRVATVFYGADGGVVGEHILHCDGTITSWGSRGATYERVYGECD